MSRWSLKEKKSYSNWRPNQSDLFKERFNFFSNVAKNRYKWDTKNNSYGVDGKIIEDLFFNSDFIGVWTPKDTPDNPVITPVRMSGNVNFLNIPIVEEPILVGDSLVYDNEPITWVEGDDILLNIALYCRKMQDIQTAKDQQIFNQRSPLIALAGKDVKQLKQKMAVETIMEDIKMLLVEEGLIDSLQALNLHSQFNVASLDDADIVYHNKIFTRLALDTTTPKKERLIVDEQEVNNGILSCLENEFTNRRKKLAVAVGWSVDFVGNNIEVENGTNTN
jgi:Phage Connector (GP10).